MCTVTGLSTQRFATASAASATALVPDAEVSPAPRSQTLTVSACGPSTRTSCTFVRSGKRWCVSSAGPSCRSVSRSGSARTTACGLPTDTGVTSTSSAPTSSRSVSPTSTAPTSSRTSSPSSIRAATSRAPTRRVTSAVPERCASHLAAMRAPFPESSAVEPSGFQTRTSACAPSTATISSTPSEPMPASGSQSSRTRSGVSASSSTRRYALPSACHFENLIGDLRRGPVRANANQPRRPPQPLPLVGGVAARADDHGLDRLVARERGDLVEAEHVARCRRDRPGQRGPHLLLDAGLEHRAGPLLDAPLELGRLDLETEEQRRAAVLLVPQPVAGERASQLRELERTDDAAAVVRMDGGRGLGIERLEPPVRVESAVLVVELLPAAAGLRRRARRQPQVGECRTEVQAGAPDDDGRL